MVAHSLSIHSSHYNSYHLHDSLLFLFILDEMIHVSNNMQQIVSLLEEPPTKNLRAHLAELLTHLVGKGYEGIKPVAWKPENGSLTKLRNYCSLYAQLGGDEDRYAIEIHRQSDAMWLTAGHCLKHLREEGQIPTLSLNKVFQQMVRFKTVLKKMVFSFRDNENVLFFLLKHRPALEVSFGERFVYKSLSRMFQGGMKEAEQFMCRRFKKRGFDALQTDIERLMTLC